VDLARTFNSHGFTELAPARLDVAAGGLELTLRPAGSRPRRVRVLPGRAGRASVQVLGGGKPSPRQEAALASGVRHVLRLDQDLSGFYRLARDDPDLEWVTSGAGRMVRSPTVFEDVVKTICTTNCSWALTRKMVEAMVSSLGEPAAGQTDPLTNAFPSPAAMAAEPERFFRERVRAGYRSPYFVQLARSVASGQTDLESLANSAEPDDEIERRLLELPGVGPYAAAHIMMTLGRNSRLILDSWTRPTYARAIAKRSVSDKAIARRFRRYEEHAGLAFWLFITRDWVPD
jgi:3-methyladenine DNA glycosylase/8-oxoguanine DNA glycosylase